MHTTPAAVGHAAPPFTLHDQYDAAHAVAFASGSPVVIVFADRASTEQAAGWAQRLVDGLGRHARLFGVAAVGAVPALFHGVVRGFLHGKPSVLLDWDNRVSDGFGYAGGDCLVVAVGGDGAVRARAHGAPTEASYAEVLAAARAG